MTRTHHNQTLYRAEKLKEYDELIKMALENLSFASSSDVFMDERGFEIERTLRKIKDIIALRDEEIKRWEGKK